MMKIDVLKKLNIEPDEKFANVIKKYSEIFLKYNAHTNLISKNDESLLFEKHIYDSLAINLVAQVHQAKNLMDIGTGGGFPAIPAAILYSDLQVTAVDSVKKKINFINQIASEMKIDNLTGICSRTEDLPTSYRENFDIVTSRAVAGLNIILEYSMPFLKVGGLFIAYKSRLVDEEINTAQNAFEKLNCKIIDTIEYKLPLDENFDRKLIVIEKTAKTPCEFPRKAGIAKASPL